MDLYHIWTDLKPGASDLEFAEAVRGYLGALQRDGRIHGHRLTRRKLGLGPRELGEFHIVIEVEGLAQLDAAFERVAARTDPVEELHHAVNRWATNLRFGLERDFPDEARERGQERF
jgi:hypothetical protein